MADQVRPRTTRSLRLGLLVAAIIGVVTGLFAWHQVQNERAIDLDDVGRRAHALAQQLSDRVLYALTLPDIQARALLQPRVEGYQRLLGYAVFRADGRLVAAGKAISDFTNKLDGPMREALQSGNEVTQLTRGAGMQVHVFAKKFPEKGEAEGVLVVVHDVSYIDDRALARLAQFAFWVLIVSLLAVALVVGSTWFVYERPLTKLADWMRRLRVDNVAESPPPGLPSGQLRSESDRLAASFRAARSTGRALSEAALFAEQVWTPERLRAHAVASLGEAHQLVVVSNREPYMHQWRDGRGHVIVPAGGLVTALDPVLQACGGVWVAHGAGNADRANADDEGRLTVPPGDTRYTLRRVWLSREEEQGYYYGFSNEGLWPLCHLAHERPIFRAEDWEHYRQVNRRFADTVLDEVGSGDAVVLVQDYQLALVPRMLKEARPDLRVGMFWHIPWPNPEAFRICPWRAEILEGMLGADLLGFHLQQYCNNFLDTVDRVLESRLDWDHFPWNCAAAARACVRFPSACNRGPNATCPRWKLSRSRSPNSNRNISWGMPSLQSAWIASTTPRALPERFRAIARLLEKYPQYRGRFTFVQLGAPWRTHIPRYREHLDGLEALADEINWKYQSEGWKPIHFLIAHHDAKTVHAFLRMAPMCIVSSLHDGMNLVAKEYVAAQTGGDGVLVLSEFAGAARELADALIVNPYDTEQFAEAIRYGLEMEAGERRARMQRLSRQVEEHNIYRWAANFLAALAAERTAGTESTGISKAASS